MESGYWPLFRYDPRLVGTGEPLKLDSAAPKGDLAKFMGNETRFSMLKHVNPARAAELAVLAQKQVKKRYAFYERLAGKAPGNGNGGAPAAAPAAVPATAAAAAPILPATRTAPPATTPPPGQT